jgi:predicted esterase
LHPRLCRFRWNAQAGRDLLYRLPPERDRNEYLAQLFGKPPHEARQTPVFVHQPSRIEFSRRQVRRVRHETLFFGNWHQPGGVEAIERARRHVIESLGADPSRIYLAGLSNGGRGVTRAIASLDSQERKWAGVIFLSAVMETGVIRGADAFRGLPVLVVHGKGDDRIPWGYVDEGLDTLRAKGANLIIQTNQGDHFVFFSRAEEIQGWIRDWLSPRLREPR